MGSNSHISIWCCKIPAYLLPSSQVYWTWNTYETWRQIRPRQLLSTIPWNILWFWSHLEILPGLSESKNSTKALYIVSNGRVYVGRQHQWAEAQIHFHSSPPVLILRFGIVCIKWRIWIQKEKRSRISFN